ncbi:MAG TPA: HAD-IA family hydrolase [Phenylobacterium sp.]
MIRAILFDADGVLQHHGPFFDEDWVWSAQQHRDFFHKLWAHERYRGAIEGRGDFTGACALLLEEAGWTECDAPAYLGRWMRRGVAVDEAMLGWVDDLRVAGLICCLASNQEDIRAEFLESEMGFNRRFERLFFSCRMGVGKPDPAYFEMAVAELPFAPAEIAFFDDKAANVEAAARVGLVARLFETREGFAADIRELTGVSLA